MIHVRDRVVSRVVSFVAQIEWRDKCISRAATHRVWGRGQIPALPSHIILPITRPANPIPTLQSKSICLTHFCCWFSNNWIWLLKWWSNPDLMGHIRFRAKSWVPWLEPVELAFGLIALCAILALCIQEQQLDKLNYISSSYMVYLFLPIAL